MSGKKMYENQFFLFVDSKPFIVNFFVRFLNLVQVVIANWYTT